MRIDESRMSLVSVRVKHFVLRHYLWVTVILLLLALFTGLFVEPQDWKGWAAIIGVPFGFLFTIQKQKSEELELFIRLFTQFNHRYDELNEKLNSIRDKPSDKTIEDDERNVLFQYFNLCGEEYLFFRQGYIYPEVWEAWHNGMKFFRDNPRIRKLWDKELKSDSYYGLNFSESGPKRYVSDDHLKTLENGGDSDPGQRRAA